MLVPQALRNDLLKLLHQHPVLGHKGLLPTYDQLKTAYYWNNMYSDCKNFIANCNICQAKSKPLNPLPHKHREIPDMPFRTVSMDHAGPFDAKEGVLRPYEREHKEEGTRRSTKPRYCLVIVDKATRYPLLIPVPDTRAETTIKALQEKLYPLFGVPDIIICDEQSGLAGKEMQGHCQQKSIQLDMAAPENHRSNGLAEIYVKLLQNHFAQLDPKDQKEWVKAIPEIQYSLTHTPCSESHISPAAMLLGHVPRNPTILLQKGKMRLDTFDMRHAAMRQRKMDRWVKANHQDREPKREYNKTVQHFEPGDTVRIRSEKPHAEATRRGVPLKWVYRWHDIGTIEGPVQGHPDQYYVIKHNTNKTIKRSGRTLYKVPNQTQA
jgi:hypothetical protein